MENKKYITFGEALVALKKGEKIARKGWNGKGMYVELNKGLDYSFSILNPFFIIKNVNNSHSTWVPSVNDCLAEDWYTCDFERDEIVE